MFGFISTLLGGKRAAPSKRKITPQTRIMVPIAITTGMKDKLYALRYTYYQIQEMTPAEAQKIINNSEKLKESGLTAK